MAALPAMGVVCAMCIVGRFVASASWPLGDHGGDYECVEGLRAESVLAQVYTQSVVGSWVYLGGITKSPQINLEVLPKVISIHLS